MARVALASLMQEGNSFSPVPTTVATFEGFYVHRGPAILHALGGTATEIGGALAVLDARGAEPVPLLAAYATAGGPVTREAFEGLLGEIEDRLRRAGPLDGLLLALHGALVVEDEPDGEGEIIRRLRRLRPGLPIAVTLDLHGHVTPAMLRPGVFHVAYRTYPHVDLSETGERAATLLLDVIDGRPVPAMALAKRPLIVSPVCTRTTDGPFRPVAEAARAEKAGGVLHAGLFPVQPWLDVPDLGFAALVCADAPSQAEDAAERLADLMWARRHDFVPDLVPLADCVAQGLASPGLTVVADAGDAPTGGSAADSPEVLRVLLRQDAARAARPVLLALCDPAGAAAAHRAGPGARVSLALGHAFTPGEPVGIEAVVESVSDGAFRLEDGGPGGVALSMGATAVLAIGAIRLVVRSRPAMEWDRALFASQGLDVASAALAFVKSPSHFRGSFGPLAARILVADTPGPTAPDMRRIPFARVTRPLHPLDPL